MRPSPALVLRTRTMLAAAVVTVLTGVAFGPALPAAAEPDSGPGPVQGEGRAESIPGRYLVVYKDQVVAPTQVPDVTSRLAGRHRAAVDRRFSSAVRGFAGRMSAADARALAADPAVAFVQADQLVTADGTQSDPPTPGLDRIDQRNLPLDFSYTYPEVPSGVTAYVIDSGIRTTHTDFGGRASWGTNTVGDGKNYDCAGHGTHVAGTIGGRTYGVAKTVKLVAVKALGCSGTGTSSSIVGALDWVSANAKKPAVVNMSLSSSTTDAAIDAAVNRTVAAGLSVVVASGNVTDNACNHSPARVSAALTVNAAYLFDQATDFSNYGPCTDLYAPGSNIPSDWATSDTATSTESGTSMAAPHVAGVVALRLAVTPKATPAQIADSIIRTSTAGLLKKVPADTPNRLLYNGPTIRPTTLCSDWRLAGTCVVTTVDVPDLRGSALGDNTISSFEVPAGQWLVLYRDAGYTGTCQAFNHSVDLLPTTGVGNDAVSSYRIASNPLGCPTA